jgi:hypothetical protein
MYDIPKSPPGKYSLAEIDANVFFGKVTVEKDAARADFEVWSSASHGRLARWSTPFQARKYGLVRMV